MKSSFSSFLIAHSIEEINKFLAIGYPPGFYGGYGSLGEAVEAEKKEEVEESKTLKTVTLWIGTKLTLKTSKLSCKIHDSSAGKSQLNVNNCISDWVDNEDLQKDVKENLLEMYEKIKGENAIVI